MILHFCSSWCISLSCTIIYSCYLPIIFIFVWRGLWNLFEGIGLLKRRGYCLLQVKWLSICRLCSYLFFDHRLWSNNSLFNLTLWQIRCILISAFASIISSSKILERLRISCAWYCSCVNILRIVIVKLGGNQRLWSQIVLCRDMSRKVVCLFKLECG